MQEPGALTDAAVPTAVVPAAVVAAAVAVVVPINACAAVTIPVMIFTATITALYAKNAPARAVTSGNSQFMLFPIHVNTFSTRLPINAKTGASAVSMLCPN